MRRWVLGGFAAALLIWLGALVALLASAEWLAGNAHYIAAAGLLACILLVAFFNARRWNSQQAAQTSPVRNPYAVVAAVMLAGAAVLIVLWLINAISLFWVEIVVALLFAIFWATQTISIEREASKAASSRPQEVAATRG